MATSTRYSCVRRCPGFCTSGHHHKQKSDQALCPVFLLKGDSLSFFIMSSFQHFCQWHMTSKTKYTFIPLPLIKHDPCTCWKPVLPKALQPAQPLDVHAYPYQTLPPLECHITPPFAIINVGSKCAGIDLDVIARECCQMHEAQHVT